MLGPPSVDVAQHGGRYEKHGQSLAVVNLADGSSGSVESMELKWVPASEWRKMSDEDQRAMIRAGITAVEDLPEDFRREVEGMLADHRDLSQSA